MVTREAPASTGQRLLAMIAHYRTGFGALSCPVLCRLVGRLDVDALRTALNGLTAAHEALRTTFTGRGSGLTQLVHDARPMPLIEVDLSAGPAGGEDALSEQIAHELARPIDISAWPTRATLWRTGPREHTLCVNAHHIVTDAWSTGVLFTELRARYARALGAQAPLSSPVWQYRDFVAWQEALLAGRGLDRHRAYWQRQLADLRLPTLPYRDPGPADAPGVAHTDLAPAVVDGLRGIARSQRTTPFSVALALFYAVLHRVCEQDDLAVASLFANRSRREAQSTVGFLANMVVLRTLVAPRGSFVDLVRATHGTVMGAFAHQEQPYQTLPALPAGLGGRADDVVFQMMVELDFRATAGEVDFELLVPDRIGSRFGLELAIAPRGRSLRAVLFYTPRLDPSVAAAMLHGYAAAAAAAAADPAAPLAALGR